MTAEDLAQVQPVHAGAPYRTEEIAAAIDRLFATGRFKDIRVEAEPRGDGVAVRFVTTERWFIGGITIEGKTSNPPNRGQLINTTNLMLGTPYTEQALKTAEANMLRVLRTNGLYEATVTPELERDPEGNQVHFTFRIKPGRRARYTRPVIQGDPKLSENTIIKATGWRYRIIGIWKHVYAQRTREGITGIQKKYQSQDRLMADVKMGNLAYDPKKRRLQANLNITAGPKVRVRAVEAKVSKGKLKKYVPIYEERRVDRDLLVEGARNLRDYFQSRGYYDVDVDFRQRQDSPEEMTIEYAIASGRRYTVTKVEVTGNHYFQTGDLRERMFVQPRSLAFRRGRFSEAMRKKDEENIANLYKSNGFRDVKVTSTVERGYNGDPGKMAVLYHVEEGPQWFVDDIQVNGVKQIDKEILVSKLHSMPGQPFSDLNVASDRSVILSDYYSGGFPSADFQWASAPSGQPNRVNLTYNVKEGERQFVRDVLITGFKHTRPSLIEKNIHLEPGDPLSPTEMLNGQKELYDRGIFARVNAAIQNPEGQTEHKYVLYDIEEAKRYTLSLGFGAELARFGGTTNTLDTPGGSSGFSPRVSMDLSRLNFLGLGHVVSLRSRVSTLDKQASINYLAPRFHNIEGRSVTVTALWENSRDVRTFSFQRREASLQVSQQLSKPTTVMFRVSFRRVSTSDIVIPTLLVPALLQPVRIGIFSTNLVQDRRNDPSDTRRGIFNTLDMGIATRVLGGQRTFMRTLGRNATYHPLTRNVVLARQTTVGLLFPFAIPAGLSRTEAVPLPERFFGGGSTSHRGFPDNQAGPRDIGVPASADAPATQPTGFPLGGNALLFNNVELRFPLIGENIRGVLFHDAGNVYSNISNISFRQRQRDAKDFDYMVHAVGFGIRYKTPIGPVRADLAYSINPPSYVGFKGTINELLQCNPNLPQEQLPAVCRGAQQNVSHFQFFFSIGQTF